jgi:hypothetical protein
MNVLLLRWDTKPAAHQGDFPNPSTDTQNVFLCREGRVISRYASRSIRDGLSPARTPDEAERIPGRISKHSLAVELGRAEAKHMVQASVHGINGVSRRPQ